MPGARRDHDQTTAPEPQPGIQGQGGGAAIKGERTPAELAEQFDVPPDQITRWRAQLLEGASGVFGAAATAEPVPAVDVKTPHAKIGELTLENDFSSGARSGRSRSIGERKAMIERTHRLSLGRQAKALGVSRGSVYYLPRPTSDADLTLMRRIDELHLEYPFAGSRMLKGLLRAEGHQAGRLHVSTLMKRTAIEALYRRPNTSKPAPGHKVCPYLLRDLAVTRPIPRVWALDITCVPMARGFVHLAAVVGWFSRKVLAWRLSITLSADFRIEALEEALARHGRPEIFNSDQGSQFASLRLPQGAAG